jgi:hypothetical protein
MVFFPLLDEDFFYLTRKRESVKLYLVIKNLIINKYEKLLLN